MIIYSIITYTNSIKIVYLIISDELQQETTTYSMKPKTVLS